MKRTKNIKGKKFNTLTAVKLLHVTNGDAYWQLECDCGDIVVRRLGHINDRSTCSVRKNHSLKTKNQVEYNTWRRIRQRCNDSNYPRFNDWGGRGIKVCKRWDDFSLFLKDMGRRPGDNYSIERINNEKGYEPENCRWATAGEQNNNKRVYKRSKTGISGVRKLKVKYVADARKNGELHFLGYFNDFFEACCARKSFEANYG